MTLMSDAKFKEKLTCGFKHDMRSLRDCNWTRTLNHLVRKRSFHTLWLPESQGTHCSKQVKNLKLK